MSSGLTPAQEAFLAARDFRDKFGDMSADEIEALSFADYAARTGRTLSVTPEPTAPPPAVADVQRPASEEHPGIDFSQLSMTDYAQLRGQLGVGGREYGRGTLDGGSTADWIAAAQQKAGRSAWQGRNVVEPPQLERYVRQDEHRDTRSIADRFSTPGNSFQIH